MEQRESTRSRRRIPCEFQHQGHRYRGIAVNASPSGLFIQTDATLEPGVDLEVVFPGSRVPGLSLRGTVVRRRAPPAELASLIRAGLGLRISEAPDAYLEFLGAGEREKRREGERAAEAPETPPAERTASARETSGEAACREPATARASRSAAEEPPRDEPARNPEEEVRTPEALRHHGALLIGGSELDDVYAMLEALGADPVRHQAIADEDYGDWENPPRAVVVSARAAARLSVGRRASESGITTVAVAEGDSQTLFNLLRRQGYDYVVRRPVHPEALRLLLMRALYRGPERRSQMRLPLGCKVTGRWGIWRRPVTVLEISAGGCRFLAPKQPKTGARVSLRFPPRRSGERSLTLRGRARRSRRLQGAAPEASAEVALAFEPLSQRSQERLEMLLASWRIGPPAHPPPPPRGSADSKQPTAGDGTEAGRRRRRRWRRAAYEQEVIVLDDRQQRARHVLLARDLSVGGARVDPHPDLRVGERFKLALYGHASPDSIVVDAEVLRDEGERGLALRFLDTPDGTARKIECILERAGEIERCDAPGDAHPVIVAERVQAEGA